jgi:hypothetical protein
MSNSGAKRLILTPAVDEGESIKLFLSLKSRIILFPPQNTTNNNTRQHDFAVK